MITSTTLNKTARFASSLLILGSLSIIPARAGAGDQATADQPKPEVELPEKANVTVIKRGQKPRRRLRYQLQVGDQQTMVMNMHFVMTFGGRQVDTPPMRMVARLKVDKKTQAGNFHQSMKFTDVKVQARPNDPPQVVAAMRKSLKGMKGVSGTSVITPRGRTLKSNLDIPTNASPALRKQLKQTQRSMSRLSTLLPEKPMGEGGKWKVTQAVRNQNIKLIQSATYTIEHLDKDSVSLGLAITQSAPKQPMPGGAKLLKLDSQGKGSMDMHFNKQVPQSELQLNMHMKLARPGQAGTMAMDMKMDMDLAPQSSGDQS